MNHVSVILPAVGALIAILAGVSCDGSNTTAPSSTQQKSIEIAVSTPALTVMCGTAGIRTATVTRANYVGVVTMAVSGLPAGVSASLSPSQLSGSVTSTTTTIAAAETVSPGSYTITVTASSAIGTDTATYKLIVVDTPHFHMTVERPCSPFHPA